MTTSLARPALAGIPIYETGKIEAPVDLGDNTNLWGPAPTAVETLRAADPSLFVRYPSPYGERLKAAAAGYFGVPVEWLATGSGSNNMLDATIRGFGNPGDGFTALDPTFGMAVAFARLNGLSIARVAVRPDGGFDIDQLLASTPKIIYLASPNNPTGTPIPRALVDEVVHRAPGLVLIDEAYTEFAGNSFVSPDAPPNLLVTRTLSKAFGLAGLRVGFAIGRPELVREVERARGPYTLNEAGEAAAAAAMTHDIPWITARVAEARANRDRLAQALERTGRYAIAPSATNFLLITSRPGAPAIFGVADRLRAAGIEVRRFERLTTFGDAIRVTIGPWPIMERILPFFEGA